VNHRRMILCLGLQILQIIHIQMLSFRTRRLSWISTIFVLRSYACSISSRLASSQIVFVFALTLFCIASLRTFYKWRIELDDLDFHIAIYAFRRGFVALNLDIVICFYWLGNIGGFPPLSVTEPPFGNLLHENLRRIMILWHRFSSKSSEGELMLDFLKARSR